MATYPIDAKANVTEFAILSTDSFSNTGASRTDFNLSATAENEGEVFVNLHNVGITTQYLEPGDKVAQAVVVPVVHARFVASESPDIYDWYPITISDRGDGALGSTGK